MLKYLMKICIQLFTMTIITLCLLEACYRYQVIDFYAPELHYLNTEEELDQQEVDILFFGDSFGGADTNYISILKKQFPEKTIINASVVGFGIRETNLIVKSRINRFKPKSIVYQIYEGNDLLDVKKPVQWSHFSFLKNIFWILSDRLKVADFLNFRAKVFSRNSRIKKGNNGTNDLLYAPRTTIFLNANPNYIEDITQLNNRYVDVYNEWENYFLEFVNICTEQTSDIKVFSIPHCTQLNIRYQEIYKNLHPDFEPSKLDCPSAFTTKIENLSKNKFMFIPLCADMRQTENGGIKLYLENDPHLSYSGHKWLSQKLTDRIFTK